MRSLYVCVYVKVINDSKNYLKIDVSRVLLLQSYNCILLFSKKTKKNPLQIFSHEELYIVWYIWMYVHVYFTVNIPSPTTLQIVFIASP